VKSLYPLTIFLLIFTSCDSKKEGSDFSEYTEQLPTLSLPLDLGTCKAAAVYDTALFRIFKNDRSALPCGKILMGDSVILLVDESLDRGKLIRTFSTTGIELAALRVFHGSVNYHGSQSVSSAIIDNKGKIISTDSTTEYHLRVSQRQWQVSRDGHFNGGLKVDIDSITIRQLTTNFFNWHFDTTRTKLRFSESDNGMTALNYDSQMMAYKNFGFSNRYLKKVKETCEECKDLVTSLTFSDYKANGENIYNDEYLTCQRAINWVSMPDPRYCGTTTGYNISDVTFEPNFPGHDIPAFTPCVTINYDVEMGCGIIGLIQFTQVAGQWQIDDVWAFSPGGQ
jgi:hypothetical protein